MIKKVCLLNFNQNKKKIKFIPGCNHGFNYIFLHNFYVIYRIIPVLTLFYGSFFIEIFK